MLRLGDRRCICWLDYRDLLGASHTSQLGKTLTQTLPHQAITCPLAPFPCSCVRADDDDDTGATALPALQRPRAVRSDAHHPAHATHHALLSRARGVARQTYDPRRRRLAHRHRAARTRARPREGRDGRVWRRALDPRA